MDLEIDEITYIYDDEEFTVDASDIKFKRDSYPEGDNYKEPDDHVLTLEYSVTTEHGKIEGFTTATRSGFNTNYDIDDGDISCDNDKVDVNSPKIFLVDEDEEDEY